MREVIERRAFLAALAAVSVLFALLLRPFWTAIFWACIMALFFHPLQRYLLQRFKGRATAAALLTLLIATVVVILPALALASAFVREGIQFYQMLDNRELDFDVIMEQMGTAVPIIPELLQRVGVDTANIREYLSSAAVGLTEIIGQEALRFARNTASFTLRLVLMLYLLFFLLRDGEKILGLIRQALPLDAERNQLLLNRFVEVARATVKGNLIVAAVQGGLGGIIFAILGIPGAVLWSVVMGILSLIPAVGASMVWIPVAIYLYAIGEWVQATVLIVWGAIIIGLADNVLRPILVGRDTRLPDYIVLFSTLGGLVLMGINGFVIGPLIAALFLAFWNTFIRDFPVD